jgi:hypothetical protein
LRSYRPIALSLIPLLLWPTNLPAGQAGQASTSEGLKIVVVRGDDGKNNIRLKSTEDIAVKVVDASEKPVAGAEVVFQVPPNGPSGRFYDWLQTQTVKTDAEGIAKVAGFTPNDEPGRWHMRVMAQQGARSASLLVPQTNITGDGRSTESGGSRKKLWIALGIIAVGAIAGGIALASGNGDDAATPSRPVVIAPGPITVGGPR